MGCRTIPASGQAIAIVGGGFTGAAVALHLARLVDPGTRIIVFEPRAQLGLGLAYSHVEAAHRLNAPAARMSMVPDEPAQFSDWLAATGAGSDDAQAALPDGRVFAQRETYGAYVMAQLAPLLGSGRIAHVQSGVAGMCRQSGRWALRCADGRVGTADIAILATGHAPPPMPAVLWPLRDHRRVITEPLHAGALRPVGAGDSVLIIGTGLTMADSVAVLDAQGHEGRITALSRRGQWPRAHVSSPCAPTAGAVAGAATARRLLRQVRAAVAAATAAGQPWQAVFDGLRADAERLWAGLPPAERCRLLRHARPFWETHRHRLPPATATVLDRRLDNGRLHITAGTITEATARDGRIVVQGRAAGMALDAAFDWVVLTTGAGCVTNSGQGLIAHLLQAGLLRRDATGQGLCCDPQGQASGTRLPLFLIGPPTRGCFAESLGVPEIARQAVLLAGAVARQLTAARQQPLQRV